MNTRKISRASQSRRSLSRGAAKHARLSDKQALPLKRLFTDGETHPFDEITWITRDAVVGSGEKKVFEQKGVESPDFWSENAINITAAKYFRGKLGSPEREKSVRQMIVRVTKELRRWGEEHGYFTGPAQAQIFEDELTHLLVYQKGSFNSPVWFNVGVKEKPQCSACFILSVEDSMISILDWIKTEGIIFKGGSGSGVNLSPLRSKFETLSTGGLASGPVSFMRGADSVAGMIKSGGTTRRAAKMVVMNIDHPDILEFIRCKAEEEKKVRALAAAGYNMADLNHEAWNSIQFQNANNSVRITDDFMRAVEENGEWRTRFTTTGKPATTYRARELLNEIAQAAWESGDPGVQFDTTINRWHTCPNSGRINASNPCSEYMHLDDSACNLASINLMRFIQEDGTFMVPEFIHAVDIFILAQEIIVGSSSYPTQKITENAHKFRELGLGFANLGALLMAKGIPYDSEEGRAWGAAIASLLSGEAYRFSAIIAERMGPFEGFAANREPMLQVIKNHGLIARAIPVSLLGDSALGNVSQQVWENTVALGAAHGFRNSQVTVLAPTGTISFMMDCDTTGIEPDFSLVKMKQLVGGGWMRIVNGSVPAALEHIGYHGKEKEEILAWISEHGTAEGAPHLAVEHLAVFDCAVKPKEGTRSIPWQGHVKMVAAAQSFISGAISKTFNMSHETTKEEIAEAYLMAWKLGIKAFAVYRDGSKAAQPLNTSASEKKPIGVPERALVGGTTARRRLPATRLSETHKFSVAGHEGYLTYSMYQSDHTLSEIFIRIAKQGSTLSGLLDAFAISVSMALQYGVPFKELAQKFIYSRFEPAGFTENPNIRIATSILDYIFRYLALRFLPAEDLIDFGMTPVLGEGVRSAEHRIEEPMKAAVTAPVPAADKAAPRFNGNGIVTGETACRKCGGMMVRTGSCLTCLQCGDSSGGCS
ncbi:ribonucleoside-diphosphate reductase, adenosylcobalamin-dependent [Candidatus Jorgensenbacteria bacterium CG10_big_fil_rev_8_21_14_0_10_54_38]|uniref:Vitamin B12-dependent ribonucleotide reductase n=2 Tax=Candidatus Joergenseniibacteriota TaxID=1752739 RepID=A0A2M6WFU0_9BACT|nr:MAG: ribonucleoside-diphosphate reductase, adenosylcobalamin-dependent [Candidatus Jorgensenbacteria bacterium CG23_combo_of_CG06-09_8_20_14_all_54_14]PIT91646.1 MAG: ribonucleoside-diphosphate reductase, adenosylcobalamin-dependent [Candidatus Jorgensenbacteria bacterium CG10_big_fil_rev_8_21_14_0_10_54_38]